jgi:predicted helicase
MALHLHYETIAPYPLERTDIDPDSIRKPYRASLKADKTNGVIELDTTTTLSGIPPAAWEYKLGNRSAIEWVLDRYKERKPKDPTIREKFNTYRFRDYKEEVVELVGRVTAVSVATMKIISEMPD